MNNILVSLKKFLKNKNTVTILGIILILVLLYFGYTRTINQTVNPINVPVASRKISAKKQITQDDITYTRVAKIMINENVLTNIKDIIGKYVNINVTIPQGSMFYKDWIVKKDKIPGSWLEEIDTSKGNEAYYLSTDVVQTLGNNVIPGSVVDIYMMARDDNNQLMYGRLLENIKVLVVHDGSGKDVFADPDNIGSPSKIGFEVSHDFYILLKKAENVSGITLQLAPQGEAPKKLGAVSVSSATLRDYIDAQTVTLTDEVSTTDKQNNANNVDTNEDVQNMEIEQQ